VAAELSIPRGLSAAAVSNATSEANATAEASPAAAASAADAASRTAECAAHAVAAHCQLVLEATAEFCVAAKLQVACFERLGAPGWAALTTVTRVARDHGLLVIADAKRGDIDVTAAAYAQAFFGGPSTPFGDLPGLGVDALTVNPLLGRDSLTPFIEAARARGGGLFVLVRTSNPGAADIQEQTLTSGGTVTDALAAIVADLGRQGAGEAGLSDIGAVVGATAPQRLAALREAMPQAIFLLPGVGAQGGRIEELSSAYAIGPAGGLITVSRGIVDAHRSEGGQPAAAARRAAERLRDAAWSVARAGPSAVAD
jgi:orotidine-5'-phosphate decarboxylase